MQQRGRMHRALWTKQGLPRHGNTMKIGAMSYGDFRRVRRHEYSPRRSWTATPEDRNALRSLTGGAGTGQRMRLEQGMQAHNRPHPALLHFACDRYQEDMPHIAPKGPAVRAGVRRGRDEPAAQYGSSPDSPLEESGFELLVPPGEGTGPLPQTIRRFS